MDLATIAFAFSLVLLSGLSTSIGGALAVGKREPGPKFMATALGLSAGVMLYVSFMEILPQSLEKLESTLGGEATATWTMMAAFFAGIAVIAIIDRLVPEEINPHEPATTEEDARRKRLMKTGIFTAFALAIHNFPEGFATFLSGLEAPEIAIPVAVAIATTISPKVLRSQCPCAARRAHARKPSGGPRYLAWQSPSALSLASRC